MNKLLGIFKSGKDTLSSKRVCGVTGWLAILGCYVYAVISGTETPAMGELIAACVALLGVDSVTDIFKNDNQ